MYCWPGTVARSWYRWPEPLLSIRPKLGLIHAAMDIQRRYGGKRGVAGLGPPRETPRLEAAVVDKFGSVDEVGVAESPVVPVAVTVSWAGRVHGIDVPVGRERAIAAGGHRPGIRTSSRQPRVAVDNFKRHGSARHKAAAADQGGGSGRVVPQVGRQGGLHWNRAVAVIRLALSRRPRQPQ